VDAILTPVSIGELIDKITILEIKAERIDDAAKLATCAPSWTAFCRCCSSSCRHSRRWPR
jgi:hypothetical protein